MYALYMGQNMMCFHQMNLLRVPIFGDSVVLILRDKMFIKVQIPIKSVIEMIIGHEFTYH